MMVSDNSIVNALNSIYVTVNENGWNSKIKSQLTPQLKIVSDKFGISTDAAAFLAAIVENGDPDRRRRNSVDFPEYLGCNNIEFISYNSVLTELKEKGIADPAMFITPEAKKAVIEDSAFKPLPSENLTLEQLNEKLYRIMQYASDDLLSVEKYVEIVSGLLAANEHLDMCRFILQCLSSDDIPLKEKAIFLYVAVDYFCSGGSNGVTPHEISWILDGPGTGMLRNAFLRKATTIQKKGLVRYREEDDEIFSSDYFTLTKKVMGEILPSVVGSKQNSRRNSKENVSIVSHKDIEAKKLFFNKEEDEQLGRLGALLSPSKFTDVQNRLKKSGLRHGFNAILYGAPGTGKTAFVYEVARKTGRDVFPVDASKIFDKYVGESEKRIKHVFDRYRQMCESSSVAPILLFNEADAIFCKRLENIERNSDHSLNTIQNIILQEMESIDGILIATTNLLSNLDSAFDRRFLFKIEFRKPDCETRSKIWGSMLPELTTEDVSSLAEKYAFSGGNIENVVRKNMLEYVLTGKQTDLEVLSKFCDEENFSKKDDKRVIGFCC